MLLSYTLKNLLRHFWRTLATVLGVAVGIAAVLGTVTVGDNINANLQSVFTAASGKAELIVAPGASGRAVIEAQPVLDLLKRENQIQQTLQTLEYYAVLKSDAPEYTRPIVPGVQGGFLISGQETERPEDLPVKLASGTLPSKGSYGIAVSQSFAAQQKLKLGDTLNFVAPTGLFSFTITGTLKTDGGISSLNAGQVGVTSLQDLQERTYLQGRVSYVGLMLVPRSNAEDVRLQLEKNLPETFNVLYPAGRGQVSNGLVQTVQSGLEVLAATLMALAGFLAYNTFAASVVERHREFALLRTLGFTRRQVLNISFLEAAIISVLGVLVGVGLGVLIAAAITAFNAYLLEFPFTTLELPWNKVLTASLVGTLTTFAAASGPARAASGVAPMVAARGTVDAGKGFPLLVGVLVLGTGLVLSVLHYPRNWTLTAASFSMALTFVGIALVSPALLFPARKIFEPVLVRLMGIPARLGLGSVLRSRARNGVAIGAVALGIGLTVGVGGMVSGINQSIEDWVETTIIGDMFIAAATPFPADFKTQLKTKYPDLTEVSAVGVRIARYEPPEQRARNASIVLTDPERYDPSKGAGKLQFISGSLESTIQDFYKGRAVYASGTIADRYNVKPGSTVKLRTTEGWLDFRVLGIVIDYTSAGETFIASTKDLKLFGGGSPELYVLSVKNQDPRTFGQQLKKDFPGLYLDIQYNQEYKKAILDTTSRFFGSTNSLLVLAVVIAALGVANTLGMNLSERMHEMAVLRALGLRRSELMRSVFTEGIVVVVLGTLLGVLGGIALSQVITASSNSLTGYRVEPVYPLDLFLIALLASPVVGILAAFLPARRAANIHPAEALRSSQEA
ncbi:FtsX-like permease family protein [Deinococcus roseus]|uniref:ABC transporter permease n=1 Tax=Deinococcus roseus TaxID=392414 RepID=A0ABQ2CY08_9DEIO|nr:ABC transporter permease [Deinococcus roseus]GGJ25063.1 ABC transporter permease [Deinococcus roseus]